MKKSVLILLAFVHVGAVAQSPEGPMWRPVNYQKIILPTKIPEGILFSRHTRAGSTDVHTLGYFIEAKTVREKVLPKDIYDQLLTKLRRTVFAGSEKDLGQACLNRIAWAEGEFGKTKVRTTGYCLGNRLKKGPDRNKSFSSWYAEVRSLLEI